MEKIGISRIAFVGNSKQNYEAKLKEFLKLKFIPNASSLNRIERGKREVCITLKYTDIMRENLQNQRGPLKSEKAAADNEAERRMRPA